MVLSFVVVVVPSGYRTYHRSDQREERVGDALEIKYRLETYWYRVGVHKKKSGSTAAVQESVQQLVCSSPRQRGPASFNIFR